MKLGLPHWRGWSFVHEPIPIEEYAHNGSYVVRAELPGIDPITDITVMVADNEVTIDVKGRVRCPRPIDSEFRRGFVRRIVALPPGARDETLTAVYGGYGILELTVQTVRPAPIGRIVPVGSRPVPRRSGGPPRSTARAKAASRIRSSR